MYNNYYQPTSAQVPNYQTQLRTPQLSLKGRPVSSIEEARTSSIDFDGSVFYFPDLANKRIYTKQINMDGTSTLLMYELREIPKEPQPSFVTREEFESTINQLKNLLATPRQELVDKTATTPTEFKF